MQQAHSIHFQALLIPGGNKNADPRDRREQIWWVMKSASLSCSFHLLVCRAASK
jgi:hypothetical protein